MKLYQQIREEETLIEYCFTVTTQPKERIQI